MASIKKFVIRDIIDSPPQQNLLPDFSTGTTTTTSGHNNNNSSSMRTQSSNENPTAHRPGQPLPAGAGMTAAQRDDLLISPSTNSAGSNSPDTMQRQQRRHEQTMQHFQSQKGAGFLSSSPAAAAASSSAKRHTSPNNNNTNTNPTRASARNLATAAMTSHLHASGGAPAATTGAAAANTSGFMTLDSDLVSSINTSNAADGGTVLPHEFRTALSKTLFKLEAAERLVADRQRSHENERRVLKEQLEMYQREVAGRMQALEQEHKTERTSLIQAKHDRDSYKRQYDELLEVAERREQEAEGEQTRWENERVLLRKRVEETAASSKSMSQLLDAAQTRIKSLEEQLSDRDSRLGQLQQECAATRRENAGFEKRIRDGLLVDARISQKWLSEADTAKRDNQALCSSLVRSMNLLARTIEYGPLLTKGALGEGFVFCGADPNVNFTNNPSAGASEAIAAASSSAAVLDSLVRDTNVLMRNAAGVHHPPHFTAPPLPSTPGSMFPSIFDPSAAVRTTGLRVEKLRCESDFWIPKNAYDLLGRLLGWMESSCALKITPQIETQLLPALHEWFVVLNAVWRERMEEKVRGAVQHQMQRVEREAEKRRSVSMANAGLSASRFGMMMLSGDPNNNNAATSMSAADGSSCSVDQSNNNNSNWTAPPTVSIPVRRTSERLKARVEEAKRLAWANAGSHNSGGGVGVGGGSSVFSAVKRASNGGGGGSTAAHYHPAVQRWSNIAIDAVQSIIDLEKLMHSKEQQLSSYQQQQNNNNNNNNNIGVAGSTMAAATTTNDERRHHLILSGIPVMDARDVEEGLRGAAGPVSALQEIAEELRCNVESFRDALQAANPNEDVSSGSAAEEDDGQNRQQSKKRSPSSSSSSAQIQNAKVPLELLMTVHDVAAQFCDAVDDSCVSLQRAQFDIDRALNSVGLSLPSAMLGQSDARNNIQQQQQRPSSASRHLNESRG